MHSRALALLLLAGSLIAAAVSCDRPQRHDVPIGADSARPGVTAVEPGSPEASAGAGQTIYVPAYSAVAIANNSQLYQLAITLGVRNTDRSLPIVIHSIRYHRQDGSLVRDFLKTPVRVAPLAVLEFFIHEDDTSGGTASSFLVDWAGNPAVSAPVVETVMVGTAGTQGISFTCPGRVVADRTP
jgi:hypothetical protein